MNDTFRANPELIEEISALKQRIKELEQSESERKQAEGALQEQERKMSSIFRAAPVGIGMVINRVLREANDMLCSMTGYSREELLGENARMLYPTQEDFDYVGKEKYRQIGEKNIGTVETRWKKKDGTIIHIILSSTPLDFDNLAKGVTFIALDITEGKQIELALETSEEKFRNLFDNAVEGAYQSTLEGKLVSANAAYARMFGYESPEEAVNALTDITGQLYLNPDERKKFLSILTQTAHINSFECQMRRKDESVFWASLSARLSHLQDGVPFIEGFIIDITNRKQAEQALKESEERFRTVADFAYDWEYWVLPDGSLSYISPSCERITGYQADQFQHDPGLLFNIIHPADREKMIGHACAVNVPEDKAFHEVEFRIRTLGGEEIWIDHFCRPVYSYDGRYLGRRASNRDITDRKLAEETLQTRERHLQTILEASPESTFLMDKNGRLLMGNKITALRLKTDIERLINLNLYDFLPPDVAENRRKKVQQAIETGMPVHFEDARFGRIILNSIYPIHGKDNQVNHLAVFGLDISERKQAEEERERLIIELREALSKVKLLSGFLPICASCKKIRNDKGYWEQMEMYIRDHSEAEFSHGICPECADKLYPEYYKMK